MTQKKRGVQILQDSLLNKGSAFTQEERDALGLNGLLPIHISTIEEQLKRTALNYAKKRTALGKYTFLVNLLNRNETLFYKFASKRISDTLPFIYTPTVGDASMQYSMLYSQRRGIYLSYPLIDKMEEMIANIPQEEVQVIVATDGERILGLGDQGVGGMTISVGKLALYTIFAGIHPAKTLPIILDVGTNNPKHLENKLYLGWRHKRIDGPDYDRFIERFVKAIKKRYPNVLLQWEDFGKLNAARILEHYRSQTLSFNDDIQGTGAVSLAALYSACNVIGSKLSDQRVAILGGGSAGCGIGEIVIQGMMQEGLTREEALLRVFIVDSHGLLHPHSSRIREPQRHLLHPAEVVARWDVQSREKIYLMDVVKNAHPTALIGVSGQGGVFTQEIVKEMARHVERPIILPLSNPTSKTEATPNDLMKWTEGRALVATGSPFSPVKFEGRSIHIAQCNNVYIFPGVGLGAIAAQASQVTDGMFLIAAQTLARFSPALQNPLASLFPPLEQVRSVSKQIALAVAKEAYKENVAQGSLSDLEEKIDALMWEPNYLPLMTGC